MIESVELNEIYFHLLDAEFQNVIECLKDKARICKDMYNVRQYNYYISIARKLTLERFLYKKNNEKPKHNSIRREKVILKIKEVEKGKEKIQTTAIIQSRMNEDVPTFKAGAFKCK